MANLPEVDELMKWLESLDQKTAAEVAKQSSPGGLGRPPVYGSQRVIPPATPLPPMGGGTVAPGSVSTGQGLFNVAEGSGGAFVRNAASKLGKAALNPVFLALAGPAAKLGTSLGESYNNSNGSTEDYLKKERNSNLPSSLPSMTEMGYPEMEPKSAAKPVRNLESLIVGQPRPAQKSVQGTSAAPVQPSQQRPADGDVDSFLEGLSPMPQLLDEERARKPAPVQAAPQEKYQGEEYLEPVDPSLHQVKETTNPAQETDQLLQQVLATLDPVQERPDAESVQAVRELTAPRDFKQKEPTSALGKIGRGINKFLVAGSGPYDPTRYDRQQLELERAKQQFTPQEALRGDLATDDVKGTRKFNRESQLLNQQTGGLTEAGKLTANLKANREEQSANREERKTNLNTNLNFNREERNANLSARREEAGKDHKYKMEEKFPDLFDAEYFKREYGFDITPAKLKVLSDARVDPMAIASAQLLLRRLSEMDTKPEKETAKKTLKAESLHK